MESSKKSNRKRETTTKNSAKKKDRQTKLIEKDRQRENKRKIEKIKERKCEINKKDKE
jgi:hypothetical protein